MIQRRINKAKISLLLTVVAMAASSFSLSFIPLTLITDENKRIIMTCVIASVFWMGLATALVASRISEKTLRRYRKRLVNKKCIDEQKLPGVLSFSSDWKSIIIYLIMAIGLILIVTDIAFDYVPEVIMFPVISATVFSFSLHCVADGKNYKVYRFIKGSVNDETNN